MTHKTTYSFRERFWLWVLSISCFAAINGSFIYGVFFKQNAIINTLCNLIAAAFFIETLILLGVLAYLLTKWSVFRLHWGWFVFLSLLGSMAFALPLVLLWRRNSHNSV